MPEITPVNTGEPVSEAQMEAQARVWVSRVLRNVHPPGVSVDQIKREVVVQVRRARKLAFEDAARHVTAALDFDALVLPDNLSPEFKDALRRVNVLARMCRGPGNNSESD